MLAPPNLWLLGRPIPFQFSQCQTAPSRYRNLDGRHQKCGDPATIAGVYWAGDPLLKKKKGGTGGIPHPQKKAWRTPTTPLGIRTSLHENYVALFTAAILTGSTLLL